MPHTIRSEWEKPINISSNIGIKTVFRLGGIVGFFHNYTSHEWMVGWVKNIFPGETYEVEIHWTVTFLA